MNQAMKLEELRELFLTAPESEATRILAVTCSFVLVTAVLWLVYRGVLREEYTPIWMGVALALVVVSLRLDLLDKLTRALGGWTPSSTIFFLGEVFLVVICLNYAVRLSRTSVQMKNLAQEIAVLRVLVDQEALRRESEVPGEDVS
jgi:magnesium-transporting ATPase (P-type)